MLFITTPVITYEDLPVNWTEVSNGYTNLCSVGCSSLLFITFVVDCTFLLTFCFFFFSSTHIWQILCGYSSIDIPRLTRQLRYGSFCASQNWVYMWSTIYVHTRQSRWNPKTSTLEHDQPQHDSTTSCVIAQQYSYVIFVSMRFHSRQKRNSVLLSKMLLSNYWIFFKFR